MDPARAAADAGWSLGTTALQDGKLQVRDCGESGCTVRGTVVPTADKDVWSTTGRSRIVMNVTFGGGPTFAGTGSSMGQKVTITCRASGPAWSSWFRTRPTGSRMSAMVTFDAEVNSAADVRALLAEVDG